MSELKDIEKLQINLNKDERSFLSCNGTKCSSELGESGATASKYASLYKATSIPLDQEQRREKLLQEIKLRRNQAVNQSRGLVELLSNNDEVGDLKEEEMDLPPEPMDVVTIPRRLKKKKNIYAHQLMFSEWFKEIPNDLESSWLVKVCPVGTRNLVVAHAGITKAFNCKGILQSKFQSCLPSGNRSLTSKMYTILDCIYNSKLNCYFVLDVIVWNNLSLQNSETELRFFWLKSKFGETAELKEVTFFNENLFIEIESFPAELPLIQDKLSHPYTVNGQIVELDGVLFYHRDVDYIQSYTPLLGWLKPFMIPEMLCIPVGEHFMAKMPNKYTTLEEYIKLKSKKSRRKKRALVQDCDMENLEEIEMDIQV